MSNVKLVTLKSKLPEFADTLDAEHISILDVYHLTRKQICRKIFRNYDKLLIIITPITDLPVPAGVNHPDLRGITADNFKQFIFQNSSTRTYGTGTDGKFYDVYKLWWLTENLPVHKLSVDKLMVANFKTTVLTEIDDLWGAKYTEITPENAARINDADLRYPILINYSHENIDGLHRILKCKLHNYEKIKAIKVSRAVLAKALIPNWINDEQYSNRFVKMGD